MRNPGPSTSRAASAALFGSLLLGALWTGTAAGQEANPAAPEAGAWYVVRPGDTLESIARRFLGAANLWHSDIAYQPVTTDPNQIVPGQRLALREAPNLPDQAARLLAVSGEVSGQYTPLAWSDAWVRDLLQPEDGLRTYEGDSALLRFGDQTELVLTEDSVVFLRATGAEIQTVDRNLIEVVVGQAELGAETRAADAMDIEIVVGPSRVSPQADDSGQLRTRARVSESKDAKLMVYAGSSAVSNGTETVSLDTGMGVAVDADGQAGTPETLLAAPTPTSPADGSRWPIDRPAFRWDAVPGAEHYIVEICRDARCGELVTRAADIEGTAWEPPALPVAEHRWRVTAVSASGLDGYPSPTLAFAVERAGNDRVPPWMVARFAGQQIEVLGQLLVGAGTQLAVEVGDDDAGLASWRAEIDGRDRETSALAGPWTDGPHEVTLVAEDRAGNTRTVGPLAFVYDAEPPLVRWGTRPGAWDGDARGVAEQAPSPGTAQSRPLPPLEWSPDGTSWHPLGAQAGLNDLGPRIAVRPERRKISIPDLGLVLSRDAPLWIEAEDTWSRAVNLTAQVYGADGARPVLVVRAIDLLGNTTRRFWPLAQAPRR